MAGCEAVGAEEWKGKAMSHMRELQEAQERIRLLIAERDSARQQADQNWKLREEFTALLGTDDVGEAVRGLKRLKAQRISTTQTK
jgi:hypothetical protein